MINFAKATSIVERLRYRVHPRQFITEMLDHWAYHQTGIYPPPRPFDSDIESEAQQLTHELAALMRLHPTQDVLGKFLSIFSFNLKGTDFYPTPPEMAELLSRLIGASLPQPQQSFYEPCCGTGINTIVWLDNYAKTHGPSEISALHIALEDIDPLMVKACVLQLLFYFESTGFSPASLSVVTVDVLSRKHFGVTYQFSSPQKQQLSQYAA